MRASVQTYKTSLTNTYESTVNWCIILVGTSFNGREDGGVAISKWISSQSLGVDGARMDGKVQHLTSLLPTYGICLVVNVRWTVKKQFAQIKGFNSGFKETLAHLEAKIIGND